MPEGDTIHRTAVNLRRALAGRTIEYVSGRPEVTGKDRIAGTLMSAVEARGKHLIMHFSNHHALHTHMGMTGAWHLYPPQYTWHKPRNQAAIILQTARWCAVCFTPRHLQIITTRELLRTPWLQRLGPDIAGPPIPDDSYLKRIRSQNVVPIGEALVNQTVVSGIGNVYKSEILFLERIHPLTPVAELTDEQLLRLRDQAACLMRRNLNSTARQTRFRGDSQKLWIYGRGGRHCLTCGTTVQMIRQGDLARSTYLCPACQPATPP